MFVHTAKLNSSKLSSLGFHLKKFSLKNEQDRQEVGKMVDFCKEYYYKHKVGAPIATMVTKPNDIYAFDEKHIRYIMDPLITEPHGESYGVYKNGSEKLLGVMMTRVTTIENHFKTPVIPDYKQYFGNDDYNIYQERIKSNKIFRQQIDTDAWIYENLDSNKLELTDKFMFMRVGGVHPELKGKGVTRQFWQEILHNTAEKTDCVMIISEGTQEQSIFAVKRMGFEIVKERFYENFDNEFKRRVITRVKDHPRICLQVKWLK